MQKNAVISSVLVVLILLAGMLFWAFQRGILYFEQGSAFPRFSKAAIINPIPSLDRENVYPTDFPIEARTAYETNIKKLTAALRTDSANQEAWLDLAIYYRMVSDHEGALEIWEYLTRGNNPNAVALHNLGEYYFHQKKEYERAEEYYRHSIEVMPNLGVNYTDLHEMYRYATNDSGKAISILEEGSGKVDTKERINLLAMLGYYHRDIGNKEDARKNLIEARDMAQALGDRSVANQLTREINSL